MTDPFRLTAHLDDDHGFSPESIEMMDSDELRRLHEACHAENRAFRSHFHQY